MGRQNLIRCICERCEEDEEFEANFLRRYPKGWIKVDGALLCGECYLAYRKMFRRFLDKKEKA